MAKINRKKAKNKGVRKKDRSYLPTNKVGKVRLDRIIRYEYRDKINDILKLSKNVTEIVNIGYFFIKSYLLYSHETTSNIPLIDKNFVIRVFKTVSETTKSSGRSKDSTNDINDLLDDFYENHFKSTLPKTEKIKCKNLTQIFDYEAGNLLTAYENHITNHYYKFVCRYINVKLDKQGRIDAINSSKLNPNDKKLAKSVIFNDLRLIKSDIYHGTDKADSKYNPIKKEIRNNIFNNINVRDLLYGGKKRKVKENPLNLLHSLIKMSIDGERLIRSRLTKKTNKFNVINAFPIRTSIIPAYFKIDTSILIDIFVDKNIRDCKMNINNYKERLWKTYFKTGKSTFKKTNYKFAGSILTDGYAVSVLFEIDDNSYLKESVVLRDQFNKKDIFTRTLFERDNDRYLHDLTKNELKELSKMKVIGADPNKEDLVYMTDGKTDTINKSNGKSVLKTNVFRYTKCQRRKEMKSKKYSRIKEQDKSNTLIDGRSVKEIETELSEYNLNTCVYQNWIKCLKLKNSINEQLREYYSKQIYRQLKWYTYLNKNRSEQTMLDRFHNKFGSPKEVVIAYGDHSTNGITLKNQSSSMGKGLRNLFKKRGYKLYLIDEYNTSARHYLSGDQLETFRKRKNPRPYRDDTRKIHGLLRTKSEKSGHSDKRSIIINRDLNASLNILLKATSIIKGKQIPDYMNRKKNNRQEDKINVKIDIEINKLPIIVKPKKAVNAKRGVKVKDDTVKRVVKRINKNRTC